MYRLSSFLVSSVAFKATPLLQSAIIISLVGPAYYINIAPYFVIAAFISSLFVTGIVPGYIRSVGEENVAALSGDSASPSDYAIFVLCAAPVSICLVFALYFLGAFGSFLPGVAAIFALSTGVISVLVPVLLIQRRLSQTLVAVGLFFLASISASMASQWLSVNIYQYVFLLPSLALSLWLCRLFFTTQDLYRDARMVDRSVARRVVRVLREIGPVFVPNVFWVAMLFWFAERVSASSSDPEVFSWYVTGLQMFGVFNFIPNSLAPLMLLRLTSQTAKAGHAQAVKTSMVILVVAVCVLFAALIFFDLILASAISAFQRQVWLPMIAAGCITSTFAPLNAYLVKQRRAFLILPGAIVWTIVAHGWMHFAPESFSNAFFVAYLLAWCVLLACVWLAKQVPMRERRLL